MGSILAATGIVGLYASKVRYLIVHFYILTLFYFIVFLFIWQAFNSIKEAKEKNNEQIEQKKSQDDSTAGSGTGETKKDASWFSWVGKKNFYEGGFEDKMDRSEAARILGVRESASAQRIKAAHRRILMLNHPDTGGSTFIASKINEAKELLLKDKK